ncbi:hypothetical protein [Armatimonas sp.]|uniref:hypothetical protein n=1 Tax=Armatimonas sp. TaxID=1872638 RepID=UPI00286D5DEA|nr:hypothetical protein [Armatimonas sp.]
MRRLTLMTALLGLTLLVAPMALAARPKLTVAPRYGKALMPCAWQPVTVTVTNPNDGAAFVGEVVLSQGTSEWHTPISLPAGASVATATLTFYERPEPWLQHTVVLRSDRGEVLTSQSWSPAIKPDRLVRVLVVSNDGSAGQWERLNGNRSPVHKSAGRLILPREQYQISSDHYLSIVAATPSQLTELASDLDQFGIVALREGVLLTETQNAAVERWVNAGGSLVKHNKSTPPQLGESLQGNIHAWPKGTGGQMEVPGDWVPNLTSFVGPKNYVASLRSYGISPGEEPSLRYTARQVLFPEVLQSSGVQAPPFSTIALFLGAYLIAVVPLQYIILRRLDKREWAWGTTPLLACGFAVGAYVVGSQGRPRSISYSCAAVVETTSGQTTGAAVARFGLYSPSRANFSLSAPTTDTVFFSTVGDQDSLSQLQTAGQPTKLMDFSVPQWAMRSVSLHTTNLSLGGGVAADLKREGEFLTGKVTNNTGKELTDVRVYCVQGAASFARLAPGETQMLRISCGDARTRIDWTNNASIATNLYPLLASTLENCLDNGSDGVERRGEAMITAFTSQELVPIKVEGGVAAPKVTNSLLIVHVPISADVYE